MVSKEKARQYRQTGKTSTCRKIPKPACVAKSTCKYANGKIRHFCRKKYNTRSNRVSSSRSSTSGSHPVLNLQELRHGKPPLRLQPVPMMKRDDKIRLDDWSSSSSTKNLQPVANRRKVNNERGLDDWGSSE